MEKGSWEKGEALFLWYHMLFCSPTGKVQNWGVLTIPREDTPGPQHYIFFINHRKIITGFPSALYLLQALLFSHWFSLNSAPCIVPALELCMSLSLSVPEHKGHTGPLAPLSLSNYCSLRASVSAPVYFCVFFRLI